MRLLRLRNEPDFLNLALKGAVLGGALLLFCLWYPPDWVLCPFRYFSGYPCPLCGLTHALCEFGHGNWARAVHIHLLSPLVFALFAFGFSTYVLRLLGMNPKLSGIPREWTISAFFAMLLGNWIHRLFSLAF